MEYMEAKCPKCHEVMQVPKGREKIICMFCGHEFLTGLDGEEVAAEYAGAKETLERELQGIFSEIDGKNRGFARGIYQQNFERFCGEMAVALKAMGHMVSRSQPMEAAYDDIANLIIEEAKKELSLEKTKYKKTNLQLSINMYMVTFVIPAILSPEEDYMPLAEQICQRWKESFKDSGIRPAKYESLSHGFKRKLCYITTAVCESLHKDEDCYELRLLKDYRDGYLSDQPDGADLIRRYYDIAPTIVKRIGRSKDRDRIYQDLWKDYIAPCVGMIEKNQYQQCRDTYMDMVHRLQEKYMMENNRD